ncbi:uncharacterized protein [Aegilops tauschii subsp. strangulata]|uniref:uncharacterized protein n=1 Tax=Aegilops tauschii subsp. strangulata TaxID=200361 RepID=UPI000989C948|nr:uncharacterized protein LOC109737354 [Aegilops tauschii subsp. strangulata]
MEAYLEEVRKIEKQFLGLELQHVAHGTNKEADDIAKMASHRLPQEPSVFEERLFKPSAAPSTMGPASPQEELPQHPSRAPPLAEGCWTEEFKAYLLQGALPEKEEDAERVARQATAYYIQDGELYRKRPNDVSLRCISWEQGHELLADMHGGDCGHYSSSHTLVGKAFRSGFYWPTTLNDATELVRSCEAYQFHAKKIHQPAQARWPVAFPDLSPAAGWLIIAATASSLTGGGAAAAGGGAAVAKGKLTLVIVAAVSKAKIIVAAAILGAAPHAAAVFTKHPHI